MHQHLPLMYPPKFTQIGFLFENIPSGNPDYVGSFIEKSIGVISVVDNYTCH
jgi:hypothetical protein